MTITEIVIAIAIVGGGLLLAFWLMKYLWRSGFVGFVGNRIVAPAIVSILVGLALAGLTDDPSTSVGGGAAVSLITLAFGGRSSA